MKTKLLTMNSIIYFIIGWIISSQNCFAKHVYEDDYYFTGSVNVITDQSKSTIVEPGIFNYTASKYFNEKTGTYYLGAPYTTTKNINGFQGIKLGNDFFTLYGYRDDTGTHLVPYGTTKFTIPSKAQFVISVATSSDGSKYIGNFNFSAGVVGVYQDGDKNPFTSLNISNMTFTISNSTCAISTSHDMIFYWNNLSPSQIQNGSSEVKTAPVRMDCSNSGGVMPVAVTFNSTNGSYDAVNGIVKTNLENLGLLLTWASTGKPIPQEKEIDFPATSNSSEDFNVNATPVQLGSGIIKEGDFSTNVTMSIEYR